jgi:hypothetical protein
VRLLRNHPGRPSDGGGIELGAELCCSASSAEDIMLLVIGFLGGSVCRGLLCIVRVMRKCLHCGLIARNWARAISMILAQVSGRSAIVVCRPSTAANALYRAWRVRKEMPARGNGLLPAHGKRRAGNIIGGRQTRVRLTESRCCGMWRRNLIRLQRIYNF